MSTQSCLLCVEYMVHDTGLLLCVLCMLFGSIWIYARYSNFQNPKINWILFENSNFYILYFILLVYTFINLNGYFMKIG